jgi:lincosamide nucleotidyltransferase A/C/D/E
VDALLRKQSRRHDDLDVLLEQPCAAQFIAALTGDGYSEKPMDYSTPAHTVWEKEEQIVDLHLFEFGPLGNPHYEGESCPAWILDGKGRIADLEVLCLSPAAQVMFHQGYEHDENDEHDLRLLCAAFALPIPDEYKAMD